MAARKPAKKVKTIPRGTPVTWHYRSAVAVAGNSIYLIESQAFISGNAASSGTFFKLPAGYVPTNSQGFAVGCTSSADSTDGRVDTSGNLSIANVVMPAAQTFFVNDVISLD